MITRLRQYWQDPDQLLPLVLSGCRSLIGLLWLVSLRWKLPPTFAPASGMGLRDWMELQVAHPAIGLYGDFVANVVLPNFVIFAWLTFLVELAAGLSLTLGLFSRIGALLGLGWSLNLAVGLIALPDEWFWSYIMLVMWHGIFLVSTSRQTWSLDALIRGKFAADRM